MNKNLAIGCDGRLFKTGEDVTALLDKAMELGLNVFDSARMYGESERVIGEYIRSHGPRDRYFVISKGCHPSLISRLNKKQLVRDMEKSLKTLDIGYIDLYFLHRDDHKCDLEEIIETLHDYMVQGKIKAYGVSNWKKDRIEEFNRICQSKGYPLCAAVSNNFTLVPWVHDPWGGGEGCVSISKDQAEIDFMVENNLPLYDYSPLGRGFLTGRDVSELDSSAKRAYVSEDNLRRLTRIKEIAKELNLDVPSLTLAYLANHKMNVYPVVSTSSPARLEKNFQAMQVKLPKEVMDELENL